MKPTKPLLAITMGDPAGVGPETIAAAWAHESMHARCRAVVVGHPEIMRRAVEVTQSAIRVVSISSLDEAVEDHSRSSPAQMPCLACGQDDVLQVQPGKIDRRGGQSAFDTVSCACQLALAHRVDGIVTAPLNKAAFAAAGHDYPGHTELLADLCQAREVAMMLYLAPGENVHGRVGLGVAHVTLHMAMRDIFSQLTEPRIVDTARLADAVTRALLGPLASERPPRIGVCALNPHAGEQTLFGDEERRVIEPAVSRGVQEGLELHGPIPADTLLSRAAAGEFDAVVAMYHDQGHIALKLLGMHRAVNITLGLPMIRTSVAHGTAFDLAWQGKAYCDGMIEAVNVAAQLVKVRRRLPWMTRAAE